MYYVICTRKQIVNNALLVAGSLLSRFEKHVLNRSICILDCPVRKQDKHIKIPVGHYSPGTADIW
jgi:hypothetical protein